MKIGYWLSSEEHGPRELVRSAQAAEAAGFEFALISDHYHPWIDRQGQSPFVWDVIGGIAATTERLVLGTGVTCPTMRIHPAVVAQAAATAAAMMPGRFFLGVGTGENLNEHVIGRGWPDPMIRIEMLEEAVAIIRDLFEGDLTTHRGKHFTVEDARLYTLPEKRPPIYMAASGKHAIETAGRIADGYISVGGDAESARRFDAAGGRGKPKVTQFHMAWAKSEEEGRRRVYEIWPTSVAAPGTLGQDVRLPSQFEELSTLVSEEQAAKSTPVGPDPETYVRKILELASNGYDHVAMHHIGPDQGEFIRFCEREILPRVRREAAKAA